MTTPLPLISILINNYNYAPFLGAAIESALNQTYPHTEVIVVDDGSTDDSRQIIASYGSRIIPIIKGNGGQASAFNAAFAASQGAWICLLDSDDLFHARKVERVQEFAASWPGVGFIAHNLDYCTAEGKPLDFLPLRIRQCSPVDDRQRIVRGKVTALLPATSGLCFRRDVLAGVLPMPEEIRVTADNYLKSVALSLTPVLQVPDALARQRIHGQNLYTLAMEDRKESAVLRCAIINATIAFHLRKEHPLLAKLAYKQYGRTLYQVLSCQSEESREIAARIRAEYSVIDHTPSCGIYVAGAFTKALLRDLWQVAS